jgi:signal transduction histidine kinase
VAARDRLRDFAGGVYPATLRSEGLAPAIGDLARRSLVPVTLRAAASTRYDPAIESTLYFVCSEALANVAKHARASHIWVELDENDAGARLRIDDDGVGGADVAGGSGLRGLADRVEALGGSLAVETRPGGGSSVTAALPRRRSVLRPAESVV